MDARTSADEPPQAAATPVANDLTPWMPVDASAAAPAMSVPAFPEATPAAPIAEAPVRVQLPQPPPEPFEAAMMRPAPQVGDMTAAWRVVFCIGWVGVILMLVAVWKSGRTIGLAPWWLGPNGDPHGLLVNLIPFVPPVAMLVMAGRGDRHIPWAGVVASLALGGIAAGDLGRFAGIGLVELAAALAGLLVSLATLAGVYRRVADADVPDADSPPGELVPESGEVGADDLVGAPSPTAQ